ncbi:oxygen-independent coproporphyrinogen III oxidase [Cerasibacillus terrae]|uniref:Heme chaperone HemW n=1 Tax=Cerasibacillus terrae TaxID=2498845 RepID=A0A5C8P3Z1_9BACI|nr:radical SAM family heme chaperone HemW [Cerasibacillus terrae]TXL68024.1 oxygen-independent coproporphyrinogen III oxidase [Cerasibacillus terrae]
MIQSAYIHIPFCHHICHYCDFTKFFYNETLATDYLQALKKEIQTKVPGRDNEVKTIFIGGGTPTALNISQLQMLLEIIHHTFDVESCEEFSIEANPGDFDKEKIKLLKEYGVNRVSLGVQVFDNEMLKSLGRAHQVKDVYRTVSDLQQDDFTNISIDLIYALPHQTAEHFQKTVEEALSFQLPHYSAYSLQVEPKTIFYNRLRKGELHRPEQEEEVKMYAVLRELMAVNDLNHYEISNFSKPGFESKHNLTYWNNDYYYGFGAGASGYIPGKRMINIRPLPAYIKQAELDGNPTLKIDKITLKERIEEELFLGLRKQKGISDTTFIEKFGFSYHHIYGEQIDSLKTKKWVVEEERHLRLTEQGLLFGNDVFEQFLIDGDIIQVD